MTYNYAALGSNSTKIAVFNTDTKKWRSLPSFENLRGSTLVAMSNQIAVVGGHFEARKIPLIKNKEKVMPFTPHNVSVWDRSKEVWQTSPIKLPQGVFHCNAIAYKHWLVLMGYTKEYVDSDHAPLQIQMLNRDSNQWFARSLSPPLPLKSLPSLLEGDTWYILSRSPKHIEKLSCIFLPALTVHVTSSSVDVSSMWRVIELPYQFSFPLYINGSLVAVGGATTPDGCYTPMSTIRCFHSESNEWALIGHLPFPICKCVCSITPEGSLQLIGGCDWKDYRKFISYSNSITFLSFD